MAKKIYKSNKKWKKTIQATKDVERLSAVLYNDLYYNAGIKTVAEEIDFLDLFKPTKSGIYTKPTLKKIKKLKSDLGISLLNPEYSVYRKPKGVSKQNLIIESGRYKGRKLDAIDVYRQDRLRILRGYRNKILQIRFRKDPNEKIILNFSKSQVIESFQEGAKFGGKRPRIKKLIRQASLLHRLRKFWEKYRDWPAKWQEIAGDVNTYTKFSSIDEVAYYYKW